MKVYWVKSTSVLAQQIPVICVNSEVSSILTSAPLARRTLLDRVMFHVKQFQEATNANDEALQRLLVYSELLDKWQKKINW